MPIEFLIDHLVKGLVLAVGLLLVRVVIQRLRRRITAGRLALLVVGLVLSVIGGRWTIVDGLRHAEQLALASDLGVDLRTEKNPGWFPGTYLQRVIEPRKTTRAEVRRLMRGARARYLCSLQLTEDHELIRGYGYSGDRLRRLIELGSYENAEKYLFFSSADMTRHIPGLQDHEFQEINVIYDGDVVRYVQWVDSLTSVHISTCSLDTAR